ncbi:chitobiase/beta-hexosaminidase C-terminal domain-containing protein [Geomonas propionica]|uniref:Chitobiase/beta-hexosaminidase C-terminal domain-containing protein n=1 Tax=Geomonas propionica TaxID=2798582 RepID=A0ABS0YMH9_9BACT|nr:chitobiase/beta-hexosaminidase C-terminal domain-containing protein [Geomonas propionica]MBJ6799159.1 chitobiase/beta-hexosaminidase C-terminal domain-containing protein [Geomonas propionica]
MRRIVTMFCSITMLVALTAMTCYAALDRKAPTTTASPTGGTFSAPVNVTLTPNEPATTYYTLNGTTPTTSSAVYVSPIYVSSTTTLKFFSKDVAGNVEVVKSVTYTISTAKVHDPANTSLTWTGYGMCKDCHNAQAAAMYQSVHYQWKGSAAEMTTGPTVQGKMDATDGSSALNAYCINIEGSWGPCGACHAGTGAKPVATNTPDATQLGSIDCLMCHRSPSIATPYTRVRNATTTMFEPTAGIDMNNVVRTVIKPVRANCLQCHAKAGGGDAVKRGDIALASATTNDANYDVHMATGRGNLSCQNCHVFTNHKVTGRGTDLRPQDSASGIDCSTSTCHPTKNNAAGHVTAAVGDHLGRVACQSCHLARYAKDATDVAPTSTNPMEQTETHRTWQTAEWNSTLGRYEPVPTKAGNLIPKYAFWNGKSWGNNSFNAAVLDPATNAYKISRPVGAINDPVGTKLFPFKYKTASQAIANGKLVALKTATFFTTGIYDQAVQDGLAYMGMTGAAYSTVTTDEYQLLNHQIPVASGNVLACAACHPNATATQVKLITNMGYALKNSQSVVCGQCHVVKTYSGDYVSFHGRHVDTRRNDCSWCHSFSRPEKGLTLP